MQISETGRRRWSFAFGGAVYRLAYGHVIPVTVDRRTPTMLARYFEGLVMQEWRICRRTEAVMDRVVFGYNYHLRDDKVPLFSAPEPTTISDPVYL